MKKEVFGPEQTYRRYIIGKFPNTDFVESMLKAYGEICVDSPHITAYEQVGPWTIIPCDAKCIGRGAFLDLMSWLCQDGGQAVAVGIQAEHSYIAVRDIDNPFGDTVFVKFDDGTVLLWYLPKGLVDDMAYDILEDTNILQEVQNYEMFLNDIGASEALEKIR